MQTAGINRYNIVHLQLIFFIFVYYMLCVVYVICDCQPRVIKLCISENRDSLTLSSSDQDP